MQSCFTTGDLVLFSYVLWQLFYNESFEYTVPKQPLPQLSHVIFNKVAFPPESVAYIAYVEELVEGGRPKIAITPADATDASTKIILAKAVWQDRINVTGWGHFRVEVPERLDVLDSYKAYGAGVLEGFLTHSRIRDFYLNTRGLIDAMIGGKEALEPLRAITYRSVQRMQAVARWNEDNPLASEAPHDRVDQQVRLMLYQIWGLSDAYQAVRAEYYPNSEVNLWPQIDLLDMHRLSSDGDYPDLKDAVKCNGDEHPERDNCVNPTQQLNGFRQRNESRCFANTVKSLPVDSRAYVSTRRREYTRCSALVRLADNNSDVLVGHTTWEPYSEMVRILKYYDLPYKGVVSRLLGFSSYPGAVTSTDDFVLTSAGLVVTETTIDIRNRTLIRERSNIKKALSEGRFPDFMKPVAASRLARSAQEWANIFYDEANKFVGVAGSQWMAVDYNKFEKGSKPVDGLLYLIEGIPGLIHYKDITDRLAIQGYWPSQNRPWFRDIRGILGDDARLNPNGPALDQFSRSNNPRSFAFSKLAPRVENLGDMKRVMQFSADSHKQATNRAGFSIAPRFDLSPTKPTPEGAADSKVVDSTLLKHMKFVGISGPEHNVHPPFTWLDAQGRNKYDTNRWPHNGMPAMFNFTWHLVSREGLIAIKTAYPKEKVIRDQWSKNIAKDIQLVEEQHQREVVERHIE